MRHSVQIEGLGHREAARRFGIDPRTVRKMMMFRCHPVTAGASWRRDRSCTHSLASSNGSSTRIAGVLSGLLLLRPNGPESDRR